MKCYRGINSVSSLYYELIIKFMMMAIDIQATRKSGKGNRFLVHAQAVTKACKNLSISTTKIKIMSQNNYGSITHANDTCIL